MGSSKKQTIGYRYFMGLHFGVCQGPVDALLEIRGGDRTAWDGSDQWAEREFRFVLIDLKIPVDYVPATGPITSSQRIRILAPELWGGEKKEGGIVGELDVMMGEADQQPNDYLVSQLGTPMPAFRNMLSLVFRKGMVGAMNPYPKPWKFKVRRILKGWHGDAAWYPETAEVPLWFGQTDIKPWAVGNDPRNSRNHHQYRFREDGDWGEWRDTLQGAVADSVKPPGFYSAYLGWSPDGRKMSRAFPANVPGDASSLFLHYNWQEPTHPHLSFEGGLGEVYMAAAVCSPMAAAGVEVGSGWFWWSGLASDMESAAWLWPGLYRLTSHSEAQAPGEEFANNCPMYPPDGGYFPTARLRRDALIEVRRVSKESSGVAMNPAHIVYQALTDPEWGMGYPAGTLDLASFEYAADTFHGEGLGLCGQWTRQDTIEGFIQDMVDHAGAVLAQNPVTGLFELIPIRGDYIVGDLPEFRRGLNVRSVESFERASLTETVNEITVQYIDAGTGKDGAVTVQHLANAQAQAGVVSQTIRYPFCPTAALAQRLALRDLSSRATPLCKVRLVCDRSAYGLVPGRVIRWSDSRLGIVDMPMRVLAVDTGTPTDGAIRLDLAEDVFGLPATTYMGQQENGWEEPTGQPTASPAVTAIELPYVSVHRQEGGETARAVAPGSGFFGLVAASPAGSSLGYDLYLSTAGAEYQLATRGEWAASALLAEDLEPGDTEAVLVAMSSSADFVPGALAMIGSGADAELVRIDTVDYAEETITVGRGVGDTPAARDAWPAGSRVWVLDGGVTAGVAEFVQGETVAGKAATVTGMGAMPVATAPSASAAIIGRPARPYPPGKVRVDDEAEPASVAGVFVVTWAHRDRLLQADQLVDQEADSIGPEPTTRYALRLLDDTGALLVEKLDIDGDTATVDLAYTGDVTLQLYAITDAAESWKRQVRTFEYTAGSATESTIDAPTWAPVEVIIDGGEVEP